MARDEIRRWQQRPAPAASAVVTRRTVVDVNRGVKLIVAKRPGSCACGCGTAIRNGDRVEWLVRSSLRYIPGHRRLS